MAYISGRRGKAHKAERSRQERASNAPERPSDHDVLKLKKAYEELEAAHRQVRETTIEMMMKMALAAEYKDSDTGQHLVRISDYAVELGRAVGLSGEELDILRYSAPMHDIGKIGIPDRILQKPSKLDPEEWEIMKTHTLIGGRIFGNGRSKSALVRAAAEIALGHHEKFDGSGYPYGLKGEKIPLYARIVAVVDVFDATLSERSYKKKWSIEQSLSHVRALAGSHLDPGLVDAFHKLERRMRDIHEANASIEEFLRSAVGYGLAGRED